MTKTELMYLKIKELAELYRARLKSKIEERLSEMEHDDNSHHLIYRVLGISEQESKLTDAYQNKGRFLYKYAGSFLEEVAIMCFQERFPESNKFRIENTLSSRPKKFEIDCLVGNKAYEIKWKDATTDGDHIIKEHTRIKAIKSAGYIPIRIMFFYPNRLAAIKIQETLETLYKGIGGEYYYGESAWEYIKSETDIDLLYILERIASELKD